MAWERRQPRNNGNRIPEKLRRKILKQYPYCWLRLEDICTLRSEQVHHVLADIDGGTNDPENLVGVCKPCHVRYSCQDAQKRSVQAAWDWKRQPERHPGVLD